MDLANGNTAPCRAFLFGTDAMGRDIFSMIWYGGRISLFIGFLATLISTAIAVLVGSISGYAPTWIDGAMMRLTDIVLSIPGLLLTVFLQAVLGGASVYSLAVVIGLTGWMSMAKVVRTEVLQLKNTDYVLAARCLGGSFFHILRRHLAPNFVSSILFMVVMS
ncbi:MAG: ABC transporter permease, partial [Lachnospiraceae bacterium]|nr:ABC transporter permease [Lachnospiraceae bacterium]